MNRLTRDGLHAVLSRRPPCLLRDTAWQPREKGFRPGNALARHVPPSRLLRPQTGRRALPVASCCGSSSGAVLGLLLGQAVPPRRCGLWDAWCSLVVRVLWLEWQGR